MTSYLSTPDLPIPASQIALQERCVHPSGQWKPVTEDELETPIPVLFEQWAERYGERVAVCYRGRQYNYRELNEAANRVGHAILAACGSNRRVAENDVVVLLFEQGIDIFPAIVGAEKAGKCYCPLEPTHPKARLLEMIDDARPRLVITESKHLALAHELAGPRGIAVLNVDAIGDEFPSSNLDLEIEIDSLDQLLYTSGSTGKPKGVTQTHRQRMMSAPSKMQACHFSQYDRIALFSSPAFAAFHGDYMMGFLAGAAMFPYDLNRDGFEGVAEWLRAEWITLFSIAPSTLRRILETPGAAGGFPDVRCIRMRSEPLFRDVVDLYKRHFSDNCILINMWAMTEVVIGQVYYIDKQSVLEQATAPIGYSTPDRRVHLLDEAGEPVAFGEVGEIAIQVRRPGSDYWRRAELQATRHRTLENGDWLFLSGDLGRFLPDGALLHLGRKDFMLKIRGHLVEAAEIEFALKELPGVRDAVVVGKPNGAGEQRLVAYFAASVEDAPSVSEMRRHLARTLPEYMLPALYVRMDALPLNANGKIDRLSLPEPSAERPALDAPYVAPRTPIEDQIARIWADTLGLEGVGIHDPFLELGGDSLLATQVATAVVRAFEVDIPLATLLESPTVATMARNVSQWLEQKAGRDVVEHLLTTLETGHDS